MASSLIRNSNHIDFDVVFGMEDTDLVQMFESLIATGLKNFLGCPVVFNEDALAELFTNSSVREDGLVVSTVNGVSVEISEEVFAATLLSISKEQVSISCLKKAMKIQYRLLHDILAKTIYVKAGSRPAAGDAEVAPIVKKKRTTKGKPVAAKILPVEEQVGVSTTSEQPVTEVETDTFVGFFSGSSVQTDSEIELSSSDGDTVYRSPSPILQEIDSFEENLQFDLGPVVSTNALEEQLYYVESLESPPPIPQRQESSSSSSDSQMNFDTTDFPLDDTTEAQTSLPAATVEAIDDLRAFILQRIDDSNNSLEIRKEFKAIDAKINSLDGQVAAIRNEQLEFQTKIAADILSLSTQIGDLVDYICSGDAKNGEGSSSRRLLPTHVHHSEGTGDAVRLTEFTQADIDNAKRAILERMSNEDSLRAERERDRARRERRLSRSGAYKSRRGQDFGTRRKLQCFRNSRSLQWITEPDARYSNPNATYSALETVAVYSGLQNLTQDIVIQTQATVKKFD
ncbi:hypothetical protein F511_42096 [Dorcoceras hygrometricum]|uniref:Uncharacterized protein n=1 Tax=Dorcoceras hygrometricum TaxID=472368 RepID=A0A2Z7D4Z4_9LAMI|nr:hypothetical protein F511_42096 [Dorcoceras hygrometricum]